jgi:hypothetical protein
MCDVFNIALKIIKTSVFLLCRNYKLFKRERERERESVYRTGQDSTVK